MDMTSNLRGSAPSRRPRLEACGHDLAGRLCGLFGLAAFVLVASVAGRADAASFFMKNGYILQGPVVERSEDTYVLGYPNGKVFLAKRFIESVSYDPGEEKRLAEEEALRKQLAAEVGETTALPLASTEDVVELPSTLEELMRSYSGPDRDPPPGATPLLTSPVGDGSTPSPDGPVAVAVVVPKPDAELAERLPDPARNLSLRPPKSWTVDPTDAALVLTGLSVPGELPPSVNVLVLSRGAMNAEQYAEQLKKENAESLQGYEVVREGPRDVGGKTAYEMVGKGSFHGKTAYVRQVLVVDANQVWLLSAFTPEEEGQGGSFALTEEVLKSVEFVAK